MLIVQKFGGSSVANAERIKRCAGRIKECYDKGNAMVIVLSAQGDTTDDLIEKAREISQTPSRREMDMLLSTGEQISVALMSIALQELGVPAVSLNAVQAGIVTTAAHSNARFKKIKTERIIAELDKKNIVVITGFQGITESGDITTLGRGGSDTTAVALAASLNADICEIYTDVEGVFTADPRAVRTARKLDEISYDEMLELACLGAKVLEKRSVELAKKYNISLVVRSSMSNASGTTVKAQSALKPMLVSGVAVDKDVARVSITSISNVPGAASTIFSLLAKNRISVDIILQSIGRASTLKDISFTVAKSDLNETMQILKDNQAYISYKDISSDDSIAKLSVVGAGMESNSGIAADFFTALSAAGVNIEMIATSEIKISVLVNSNDADKGAIAAHNKFINSTTLGTTITQKEER
ncbi:MAG: aspartate kinase [Clostridiales bacterium]|nr:aspartate kinase [Clostridiales bacterium]